MRRRVYLMRHGAVAYFDDAGRPVSPDEVCLSPRGRTQAALAGRQLSGVRFDRVITSSLPRTIETAELVLQEQPGDVPAPEPEPTPALRELRGGSLDEVPRDRLEEAFTGAFRGLVDERTPFLGGETIGELFDRVLPAWQAILADPDWDTLLMVLHGGVNRALMSWAATGRRLFLGALEQAPGCINVLDVGRSDVLRAVNIKPEDPAHEAGRLTTMEELLSQYRPDGGDFRSDVQTSSGGESTA